MDISTWKNLGGLSSTSTQSLQNYGNSPDINSTALYNWQYLTTITIINGMPSSPLTRLHQQQSHPVRYFQIHKPPPRSQYNLQTQIASQQQTQQCNYPQQYSLTSTNIQPENNLINVKKYENIPALSYFANQLNTKSTILSHNSLNIKSLDERQFNCQTNGVLNEIGQPKYLLSSNGHFVSPAELSLTTCFTLTNWLERLYPTIIRTNSSIPDYLPLPTPSQTVYNYHDLSALGFINIIEAVPDILKNIRPENFIFTSTLISVSIGRNEKLSQRSANKLIKQLQQQQQSSSNSEYSIAINPHWSVLLKTTQTATTTATNDKNSEKYLDIGKNILTQNQYNCQLEIINQQLNNHLSNQKTYADVLQDNSKYECDKMKVIKGFHEINSATEATNGPQRRIPKSLNNKGDITSSSDECEELTKSTANFIARAARRTTCISSTDSGISVESHNDNESHDESIDEIDNINETKCFNKMAEDFCFGPLVKSPFLLVFNEYNKYRKRMEYTKLFIEQINNGHSESINENNSSVCIVDLLDGINNSNSEINSTISYHHQHCNNHQHYYNYNYNWQSQQQWKRNNIHLSRRSQNRI